MDESRGREGGRFAGTNPCATSIKIETRLSLSIRHEPRSSADSFWIVLRAIRSFPWPKDAPRTMIMRDDRSVDADPVAATSLERLKGDSVC